uniref:Potassium/proton antiporter CemA n=1 Tax=Pseudocodium devriesii TaxID=453070 RepID=A0A386B0Z4_9CHLO|nr:Envelope membrane protein [Pseudocodium devriesii]AYC65372.1 Envelope membrane protein [Pseudocodium devriesii]
MSNFEQIGLIPRSIVRTFQRFLKQIGGETDLFAIYEFRVSRYIAIASLQCFFLLIVCPWLFQIFLRFFIINFLIDSPLFPTSSSSQQDIFLNFHQQEHAFSQIQTFSQQVYFETLLDSFHHTPTAKPLSRIYQTYFFQCAQFYHQQSLSIITNWILDLLTLVFFVFLLISATPQILIFKTFCIESLLSLSETTKCFFLIFFLDLLVGFHSSKSWEIFLQFFIEHFGFQLDHNQNFIAFFISTFPVLLDTIFKYWIFRYLNKISPSTVATYQAMIE